MDFSSSNIIMKRFLLNLESSNKNKENLMDTTIHLQDNMAIDTTDVRLVHIDDVERRQILTLAEVNPLLYKQLIHEDLTSTAGPSENYWTIIAERRRKVLAEVIKEHERLNTVIVALEEENMCCKQLLENTTILVQTLTEMINAKDDESDGNPSGVTEGSNLIMPGIDDVQHVHKKMKLSGSVDDYTDGN